MAPGRRARAALRPRARTRRSSTSMIPEAGWVEGFVRPVDLEELETRLDPWEEVDQGLYRRAETMTRASCRVWVYVYNRPLPPRGRGPLDRWEGRRRRRPSGVGGSDGPVGISPSLERRCMMASTTLQVPGERVASAARRPRVGGGRAGHGGGDRPRRAGGGDGRAVPDRPARDLGVEHIFGIPGDYVLQLYKLIEESPIQLVGMTRGGQRGLRGRRLCPDPRAGLHLRDVLRGRAEHLQQHRGGLRREVAGDRAGRLAGALGAGAQPPAAPQGQGVRDAVRGLREDHGRLGGAGQARDRAAGDRPGAGGGRPVQAAGLPRAAAGPGPRPAGQAAPARREGLPPSDPDALREALDEAIGAAHRPRAGR